MCLFLDFLGLNSFRAFKLPRSFQRMIISHLGGNGIHGQGNDRAVKVPSCSNIFPSILADSSKQFSWYDGIRSLTYYDLVLFLNDLLQWIKSPIQMQIDHPNFYEAMITCTPKLIQLEFISAQTGCGMVHFFLAWSAAVLPSSSEKWYSSVEYFSIIITNQENNNTVRFISRSKKYLSIHISTTLIWILNFYTEYSI